SLSDLELGAGLSEFWQGISRRSRDRCDTHNLQGLSGREFLLDFVGQGSLGRFRRRGRSLGFKPDQDGFRRLCKSSLVQCGRSREEGICRRRVAYLRPRTGEERNGKNTEHKDSGSSLACHGGTSLSIITFASLQGFVNDDQSF